MRTGPTTSDPPGLAPGAYGLRLRGPLLDGVPRAELAEVPAGRPELELGWRREAVPASVSAVEITTEGVTVAVPRAARLTVGHDGTADFGSQRNPSADLVLHPLLAHVAAARTCIDDRVALHGACVDVGGRRLALLGEHYSGKSTALAALAIRGHTPASDDLTVLEGGMAWPGPRCIDLRRSTMEWLGEHLPLVRVRGDDRWRMQLRTIQPTPLPLGAIVILEVGHRLELERLSGVAAMRATAPHVVHGAHIDPTKLLTLLRVPTFRLRRPLSWNGLDDLLGRIEGIADGAR